jgi:hypothetical protein
MGDHKWVVAHCCFLGGTSPVSMKNGKCPECGSHDVRCDRGSYSGSVINRANHISVHKRGLFDMSFEPASLDTYVCVSCGYVRGFVANQHSLNTIAENWPRVVEDAQEDTPAKG